MKKINVDLKIVHDVRDLIIHYYATNESENAINLIISMTQSIR